MNQLLKYESPFLTGMDGIVSQYEREARRHVATLQTVERTLFGLTLIVLVLEGLLVFRPAVRHLQATLSTLQSTSDELLRAKEAAEEASLAKSRLLANVSHELRTPLHAILGLTERTGEQTLVHDVAVIHDSASALLRLVSDLLDAAAAEAGKLSLRNEAVSLRTLLAETIETLRASAVRSSPLKIEAEIANDVPESVVTDPQRLKQVLVNLGGNAIKFTERGSVTIRVRALPSADGCAHLQFAVIDTGSGIPPAELERIFQPFTRLNERGSPGIGLGLAICRQVVDALGGELSVRSELGRGAEFAFQLRLPLAIGPAEVAAPPPFPRFTGRRVLVVDDAPINRELAAAILMEAGCEVVTAQDGEQALEYIERERFDAALIDLRLPLLSGTDLARDLHSKASRFPLIAITADHLPATAVERELFDAVLLKPAGRREILQALSDVLPRDAQPIALERLRGDAAFFAELRVLFHQELPSLLEAIRDNLRGQHSYAAKNLAHRLRGQALQLDDGPLVDLASQLESAAGVDSAQAEMILDQLVERSRKS